MDKINIPSPDEQRVLRNVMVDGYRLMTWETGRRYSTGQEKIGYAFWEPGIEEPLFIGEDYGCSPCDCVDSNECLRGIMSFLTLRKGDTDKEYFDNYTERQLAWSEEHAEEMSIWGIDDNELSDDEVATEFINLPLAKFHYEQNKKAPRFKDIEE